MTPRRLLRANSICLCFALALWNGRDPILKERLFGLTGNQGNHGEDVKEYYYYLDATPTHSWMRWLYRYPHAAYPYQQLLDENARRGKEDFEYELIDTGIFAENRYCDVFVEYAKGGPDDLCIRITVENRGPEPATIHLLPTLWFRNTWSWGYDDRRPTLSGVPPTRAGLAAVHARHHTLGEYVLYAESADGLLFTENETNAQARCSAGANPTRRQGCSFTSILVHGRHDAGEPEKRGSQGGRRGTSARSPAATAAVFWPAPLPRRADGIGPARAVADFDAVCASARARSDEIYAGDRGGRWDADQRPQSTASARPHLGAKQFSHYNVQQWLDWRSERRPPSPPPSRKHGSQHQWASYQHRRRHLDARTSGSTLVRAWDLAFHCIPVGATRSRVRQATADACSGASGTSIRTGRSPAYEWAFGDVNPPVYAWAAYRVFKICENSQRHPRPRFPRARLHKLTLNFTWWVNRKDVEGNNVFEGGFLGLDNIGSFDRNAPLPNGAFLEESDGTSWMGVFLAQSDGHRPRVGPEQPGVRGHRHQVLRALPLHRRRHEQHGRRRYLALGRAGRVLLRHPPPRQRSPRTAESAHAARPDAAVRGRGPSNPRCSPRCPTSNSAWSGFSSTAPTSPPSSRAGTSPASANGASSPWSAATA
jgi:hypothetical protein